MKIPKTLLVFLAALIGLVGTSFVKNNEVFAKVERFSMTTGGMRGTAYTFASPWVKYINSHSDKIRLSPAVSAGWVENIRRVSRGEVKFGMSGSPNIFDAWHGKGAFKTNLRDARIVGPCIRDLDHMLFVRADSPVRTYMDLVGRAYGPGAPGSTSNVLTRLLLKYAGILDQVDLRAFPYAEMLDMVADRVLEGHARTVILPIAYFDTSYTRLRGIRFLDLKKIVEETTLLKDNPIYIRRDVPAFAQAKWQKEPVVTIGMASWTIAHKDVSDDIVYEFCRLGYSKGANDAVEKARPGKHKLWPTFRKPMLGLIAPLHPGAKKFWQAQGVEIPESVIK
jgi:TRAP transporter TAXI family solute receptor